VDVTFEVPRPPKGQLRWSYFVGLRVLFTPGTSDVRIALENHPVSARIFLYRIEDGKGVPIPLFSRTKRPPPGTPPFDGNEVFELPEGEAIASLYYAQHTSDPIGTSNASTLVMAFATGKVDGWPGVYRLQVEMLDDIPGLSGLTSFLVYEENPKRK